MKSLLNELDAINNILISTKEGQSIIAVYLKGTDFAIERAKEILTSHGIELQKIKGFSTYGFSIEKEVKNETN